MATNFLNFSAPGKLAGLIFARQSGFPQAATHGGFLGNFNAWRARRKASMELSSMSDRELADIGVIRQEIPNVVKGR